MDQHNYIPDLVQFGAVVALWMDMRFRFVPIRECNLRHETKQEEKTMRKLTLPLLILVIGALALLLPALVGASDLSNAWGSGQIGWAEIGFALGVLFSLAHVITKLTATDKDDRWLNGIKEATGAILPGVMKFIPDRKKNG